VTRRRCQAVGAVLAVVTAAIFFTACGGSADGEAADPHAVVERVKGTELNRVILNPAAAKRLDIQTTAVRNHGRRADRTVIPYAAVLYDPNGQTWTYTSPQHLRFVRRDVSVDRIDGDSAILSAGPSAGMAVVTVGADELWGIEYGGIEED
jgi:hypothetical protein